MTRPRSGAPARNLPGDTASIADLDRDYEGLLDAMLVDGELRPPPRVSLEDVTAQDPQEARRRAAVRRSVNELRARAMATNTRLAYGGHCLAFRQWCNDNGVPTLPADIDDVADHLTAYALSWVEGEADLDSAGRQRARVAVSTVAVRLSAIDKMHAYLGLARPGDDPVIRDLMRGLRRTYLVRARHAKAALLLEHLETLVGHLFSKPSGSTRAVVATLLRALTGASAETLAQLTWNHVETAPKEVRVTLPGRRATTVTIATTTPQGALLQAQLVILERNSAGTGHVLGHPTGAALTRQAIHREVTEMVRGVADWSSLASTPAAAYMPALRASAHILPTGAVRTRALLVLCWWTALRRSNVVALNWGDISRTTRGLAIQVRRSKTDQEGAGRTKLVFPIAGRPAIDPVGALEEWRTVVAALVGGDPSVVAPELPVFCSVDRHGNVLLDRRLTGARVNQLVQELAKAAGLAGATMQSGRNSFGGHSLRAGFVTWALSDGGLSPQDVQQVTDHGSMNVLMRYYRTAQAETNSPILRLAAGLASPTDADD